MGFTLTWDYEHGHVDLTMPNYIHNLLSKLNYTPASSPQYSPHKPISFQYTKQGGRQYVKTTPSSPFLNKLETRWVQSALGGLLFYARALDNTMLPTLNDLSTEQACPTQQTKNNLHRLLDYANTYQHVALRFYASDMILHIDSDAAYLVLPQARSRIAGYFRLLTDPPHHRDNGAILIECRGLKHVVSSAAEAETHGVFHNTKLGVNIRTILIGLGHPQPPTPINTDNSTTTGFVRNNIQMKKSKSWDMNLHWLRDRENQKQFNIQWGKGSHNGADYFTKTSHTLTHHRKTRSCYIRDVINFATSQVQQRSLLFLSHV